MSTAGRMLRGKKAVIFDLDGTLIDSIGVWNETDRILHRELTGEEEDPAVLQAQRDEALRRFRGEQDPYFHYCGLLRERYAPERSVQEIFERRYAIARQLLEAVDYKPDADKFLWALKRAGYTLVLASTTKRWNIELYTTKSERIMTKAPLDQIFTRVYTCEDVSQTKPDSEVYTRLLEELSLRPEECLVMEDSLTGVQAAKAAGLEVAVVYDAHADKDRAAIDALADWQVPAYGALLDGVPPLVSPYQRTVQYYETDKMGVTHHANYIHWMEEARIAFLDQIGWSFDRLEAMGIVSPVMAVECRYKAPTTFADHVTVKTWVEQFRGVRLKMGYEMYRQDGTVVCQGSSEHCFLDTDGNFLRLQKRFPALYDTLLSLAKNGD